METRHLKATYRSGAINYFTVDHNSGLLIKCDKDWNKLHVTGWTEKQLRNMHYVRSLKKIDVEVQHGH